VVAEAPASAGPAGPRGAAPPPRVDVRALALRLADGAVRVLLGLLPERAGEAGGYRVERARLAAAAAVLLPLAVLALTLTTRARSDPAAASEPVAAPATAVVATPASEEDPDARVVRLADLLPVAGLPGEPADERVLAVAGSVPYVLNRRLAQVDRIEGGAARAVLSGGQVVGEEVVAGELDDLLSLDTAAGERAVVLDSAGRLWSLGPAGPAALPLAGEPPLSAEPRAAGFEGNLYVLDRAAGQVFRYLAADGAGFPTAGEPWLAEAGEVDDAVDLAVDGNVYVLSADGALRAYRGGAPAAMDLRNVPGGLVEPVGLFADPAAGAVLVADRGGGRVLVLGPDGAFRAQLLRPAQPMAADPALAGGAFERLHGAAWDPDAAALLVVDGSALYRAPLAALP
jgi:hypothetical protein